MRKYDFSGGENGDLADWSTGANDLAPGVGGTMDLGAGAKRVWVLMDHTSKSGDAKLIKKCSYPLTALGSVTRTYTNIAVIDVTPSGSTVGKQVRSRYNARQ